MVIDIAFQVIGFLAKALGRSAEREKPERLFRDFVEPIQEDLLRIQDDYIRSFAELADQIQDETVPIQEIDAYVRKQRKRFNPVRMTTGEMAMALTELFARRNEKKQPAEDSADWLLHRYTDAVIDYLYGTYVAGGQPRSADEPITEDTDLRIETRYTDFMRVVKDAHEDDDERARLVDMVRETERELERSWRVLATRFGQLKAKCLAG